MTIKEAQHLITTAPQSDGKKSRMNPSLTQLQVWSIVNNWLEATEKEKGPDYTIDHLMEKRVYQVVRNQRRPRF